jgi:hypothetical protein
MALRGTTKRRSQDQEDRIAALYGGRRSASSGAADNDSGDVATVEDLIECKTTGGPEQPIRTPKFINELGKVVEEARERGRTGALALQFYLPDHYLANRQGWVEVTVRPTADDVARAEQIGDLQREVYGQQVDLDIALNQVFDLEGQLREAVEGGPIE